MANTFGDQTGSHREFQDTVDTGTSIHNATTDNLKNQFQISKAIVISMDYGLTKEEGAAENAASIRRYTVEIEREKRIVPAIHKADNTFWALTTPPRVGDRVEVQLKRDLFEAEIIRIISVTEDTAFSIYSAITKKAG